MKRLYYITQFLFLTILFSCSKGKTECKSINLRNYIIDIKFSSFFDCGIFKRITLCNNNTSDLELYYLKRNTLYIIEYKRDCEKQISDTIIIPLNDIQGDSIFELNKQFLENYNLRNIVNNCEKFDKNNVLDGANVSVNVCLGNRCVEASYSNYRSFKEISKELNRSMDYINFLIKRNSR